MIQANEASNISRIIRERDTILVKLVDTVNSQVAVGIQPSTALWEPKLRLYKFRRDNETSLAEKIKHQELIIQIRKEQAGFAKSRFDSNLATFDDLLNAEETLLAEQQIMEELKLKNKEGA